MTVPCLFWYSYVIYAIPTMYTSLIKIRQQRKVPSCHGNQVHLNCLNSNDSSKNIGFMEKCRKLSPICQHSSYLWSIFQHIIKKNFPCLYYFVQRISHIINITLPCPYPYLKHICQHNKLILISGCKNDTSYWALYGKQKQGKSAFEKVPVSIHC